MTLFTRAQVLISRVADALLRRRRDSRLTEEIATHLELLTNDFIAQGLTPADARAAARRAFGGVDQLRAVYRDQRGLPVVDALVQDLRFAWRLLGRDRGFSVTAVLVLGLGIGVNNMLFTILNAHTIRGLPLPNAERVAHVTTFDDRNQDRGVSYPEYVDVRKSASRFLGLAAFTNAPAIVSGDGRPAERFAATFVSENAFDLLGVRPVVGRGFAPEDDRAESPDVAMLGQSVWQSRYGSDPAVLGQTVVVNGITATIIGVMPERSGFPTTAQIWLPLKQAPGLATLKRDVRNLRVLALVDDADAAISAAGVELQTIFERLSRDHPDSNRNIRVRMVPINEQFFGRLTDPAWMAFTAAGFLIVLISCANVANLLLAHATGRAREFAIRTSLGASRVRILRQLLIEGVVLAAAGAVLGFGISVGGVRLFRSAIPGDALPYWMDYSVDARVLVALVAVSLFTVLLFALVPALHASRSDVNRVLKDGGRPGGGGRSTRRWTTVFLVAEFALAVVLLAQVVYTIRDAGPPLPSDRTINTRHVVTAAVTLPAAIYATPQQRVDRFRELDERVRMIPGVASVSMASVLPLSGGPEARVDIAGRSPTADEGLGIIRTVVIGPQYFRTLGVPVIRGREFNDEDGTPASSSAIVNERFVDKFFPDANPIGQQITLSIPEAEPSGAVTIVGVAADVRQRAVSSADPIAYLPYRTAPPSTLTLLVRTDLDPAGLVPLLRNTVMTLDAGLPLYRVLTLAEVARNAQWTRRLSHMLVLSITVIAVGLSTVGLYTVTAHGVLQRTQEIGLRMALGAQPRAVVLIIVRRVLVQLAFGFVAGIVCTVAWQRMFGNPGSDQNVADPQSLGAIAAILVIAAVIACVVPARRATRLDPVAAIRGD